MRQKWPSAKTGQKSYGWFGTGKARAMSRAMPPTRPARTRSISRCATWMFPCHRSASIRPSRRTLVRSTPARRPSGDHPVLALCPREADGRDHLQRRCALRRQGENPDRRAAARTRVRNFRPPDDHRHSRALSGGGRAPPPARQIHHRPPGGESWADVILRLRSMLNTINLHYCDRRVLVVCHQVVVLCFRYILEELDEAEILSIDRQSEVLNCGIAAYEFDARRKRAVHSRARPVEPRRAAGGRRRAQNVGAGRDGGNPVRSIAGKVPALLPR